MEMKLHAQYHEWDRKNATIEALVGRGGKHKLRLFTPHERGLSQTPSRYFMDAFAKFAKVCLFFCWLSLKCCPPSPPFASTIHHFPAKAKLLPEEDGDGRCHGPQLWQSGNQADEHAPEEMMAMLPIWSICTTLGLRGGDFTSNAQAFENKGARISFHPSPARQAGRQADNHNHLHV